MISKTSKKNDQIQMVSIDQLVPKDHLLRKIDSCIDFSFIYDLVEDKYCPDNGRPSIDPVTLIKIPLIQYMYGIKSMRQTIKEIEVNMAYRWFLGLDFYDKVPHFSTFGKNYKRRFEGTDLFEQIFQNILMQCMKKGLVDTSLVFVDSTHVKACANRKKSSRPTWKLNWPFAKRSKIWPPRGLLRTTDGKKRWPKWKRSRNNSRRSGSSPRTATAKYGIASRR